MSDHYCCKHCGEHYDYCKCFIGYKSEKKDLLKKPPDDPTIKDVISPEKTQVGGDYYTKLPIQPWDIIKANNLNFFEGNVIKYLLRYKEKNGLEDLQKAKHYIEELIEIHQRTKTYDKA